MRYSLVVQGPDGGRAVLVVDRVGGAGVVCVSVRVTIRTATALTGRRRSAGRLPVATLYGKLCQAARVTA